MRLVVTADERFVGTPDGAVWTTGTFAYSFWRRYLPVFDEVGVVARVLPATTRPPGVIRVDGPGIRVHALPHYLGPAQYVRMRRAVRNAIARAVSPRDAVLVRAPSNIGTQMCAVLAERGQPYALDVVADPYEVFAPGSVHHPLRPALRSWFTRQLRRQCAHAVGVSYVTQEALQRRYPASPTAFAMSCSDVEIDDDALRPRPRTEFGRDATMTLVHVGSLAHLYKGTDVLIRAVAQVRRGGVAARLVVVGDGRYRPMLEALARQLGIPESVTFAGQVAGGAGVRRYLDEADLFVLPSRTEGLPKALVEAMARGLPCVASTVGGMPELLPPDDLVAPGEVDPLAARLREVLTDVGRLRTMSARNLARAREFSQDKLQQRREEFCTALRQAASAATPTGGR